MHPRFRISVRVAASILVATVLVATLIIVAAVRVNARAHDAASRRADRAIANSSLYEDALGASYNEWVTIIGYVALRDPAYLDRFAESRADASTALAALRDDALVHDPGNVALLDGFISSHDRFADGDTQVIAAIKQGDLAKAIAIGTDSGLTADSDRYLQALRAQIEAQRAELRASQDAERAAAISTLRWSLAIGAMSAGLLSLVAFAGYRWIGASLRHASSTTRAIARGDLTARVEPSGPAELAHLAEDVNTMTEALIHRSDELNAYLSQHLEDRTAELERANAELSREVDERRRAEESLAKALEVEHELEEQLRHQAFHDPLTGLANRARFMDRLEHAIQRAARNRRGLAVLFMDVDDFKSVNDSLGHPVGDKLLIEVASRLTRQLRPGDTAARLGGDEFAVLLEYVRGAPEATAVAERVIASLRQPIMLTGREVFVRASAGVAMGGGDNHPDELLRRADVAMYVAKSDGKGRFAIYDPAMERSMVGPLELAGDLQRGVERGEFVLHYQPSIVLDTGRIAGVEALVRWRHPARGLVPPGEFIPLAEATGLILPIGRWVLREACLQARRWQLEFPSGPPLTMAVNISTRQVQDPGLFEAVSDALAASGVPPQTLVLEITESLMMQNAELAIARLNELKALGVRLAIDDFGTGYSSLSYLRRFPVDILKIDKSFVDGVSEQGKERELAQSIIELGQTLRLEIVAEGVERPEQLGWLRSRRCNQAQGFYFSEPLPSEDLRKLLEEGAGGAEPAAQVS